MTELQIVALVAGCLAVTFCVGAFLYAYHHDTIGARKRAVNRDKYFQCEFPGLINVYKDALNKNNLKKARKILRRHKKYCTHSTAKCDKCDCLNCEYFVKQ